MSRDTIGDDIGAGAFWTGVGSRALGAVVITTLGAKGPEGFLGLSFAHVCAKPPTVLVSVGGSTTALHAIRSSGAFAANILPRGSEDTARAFGGEVPTNRRFEGVEHTPFVTGAPVLSSATAAFDCRVFQEIETPGATVFLASVVGLRTGNATGNLVAYGGGYLSL